MTAYFLVTFSELLSVVEVTEMINLFHSQIFLLNHEVAFKSSCLHWVANSIMTE